MKTVCNIFGIVMWLMLVSCAPRVITQQVTHVRDSVIVREVTKIVPVYVEGDSAVVSLTHDARGTFEKKSKRATVRVKVDTGGNIQAMASCDSVTKLLALKVNEIERLHTEQVQETKEKIVFKTRDIDKFCRWVTAAVVAGAVIYFAFKSAIKRVKIL